MIETLQKFAMSAWSWFVENKDTITAFFMSGQFASLVAAGVALIRTIKKTEQNTKSTDTLNEALTKTNKMSESVDDVSKKVKNLTEENTGLREELKVTEEKLIKQNSELMNKLNAIIDVQTIVYSTIRDDAVRQNVNTLLNNARYRDTNTKEQLQMQIDELRSTYSSTVEQMNKTVDEAVNKVSDILNIVDASKAKMIKNHSESPTRY